MIQQDIDVKSYLRNSKSDQMWRKYGFLAYLLLCTLVIAVTPAQFDYPLPLRKLLNLVPAIRSIISANSNPDRVVTWILVSIAAYPIFHLAMRSRVYTSPKNIRQLLIGLLAIVFLDAVLVISLNIEVGELHARGLGRALMRLISSDIGLVIAGPVVSAVYSLAIFLSLHVVSVIATNPNKER